MALTTNSTTISFSEKSRGWVSFKTIYPEVGFSLNNEYYTAIDGKLWKHHDGSVDRNSFYRTDGKINSWSSITVLFNDLPSVIKSFTTLNYEGSQSKVTKNLNDGGNSIWVNKYYNNQPELGWYVNSIITDQQTGRIPGGKDVKTGERQGEFINKEGKWFNYIIGEETVWNNIEGVDNVALLIGTGNLDTREFSTQGIGMVAKTPIIIQGSSRAYPGPTAIYEGG